MLCTVLLPNAIPGLFFQRSLTRLARWMSKLGVCLSSSQTCLQQHDTFFCTKIWRGAPNFRAKERSLPPCQRRIGPFIQMNTWFGNDRVPPVINRMYAVPPESTDSPPAGRYRTSLVRTCWLTEPTCPDQDTQRPMLPPAILPFTWSNVRFACATAYLLSLNPAGGSKP
jgi:hypothetical protein